MRGGSRKRRVREAPASNKGLEGRRVPLEGIFLDRGRNKKRVLLPYGFESAASLADESRGSASGWGRPGKTTGGAGEEEPGPPQVRGTSQRAWVLEGKRGHGRGLGLGCQEEAQRLGNGGETNGCEWSRGGTGNWIGRVGREEDVRNSSKEDGDVRNLDMKTAMRQGKGTATWQERAVQGQGKGGRDGEGGTIVR